MIKTARQEHNLTQEQLGELIGVQKSQNSKLEVVQIVQQLILF
jgi:DNA-binding XRE family transcriptional regulator